MQDNSISLRLLSLLLSMLVTLAGSSQVDTLVIDRLHQLYQRVQNNADNYLELRHYVINLKVQDTTLYTKVIITKNKNSHRIDYSPSHFELIDSKYRIDVNHSTKQIILRASQALNPINGEQLLFQATQAIERSVTPQIASNSEISGVVKFPIELGIDSIRYIQSHKSEQFKHYMYVNERFYNTEVKEALQVLLFTHYKFSSKKQPKKVFKNKR